MKETLFSKIFGNKRKKRLQQPIIPTEQLEERTLDLLEITPEMYNSPDIFDYSPKSFNRHVNDMRDYNSWIREVEMCQILGLDYQELTPEQHETVLINIEKEKLIGRVDSHLFYIPELTK